jgi:hypothetical protein
MLMLRQASLGLPHLLMRQDTKSKRWSGKTCNKIWNKTQDPVSPQWPSHAFHCSSGPVRSRSWPAKFSRAGVIDQLVKGDSILRVRGACCRKRDRPDESCRRCSPARVSFLGPVSIQRPNHRSRSHGQKLMSAYFDSRTLPHVSKLPKHQRKHVERVPLLGQSTLYTSRGT